MSVIESRPVMLHDIAADVAGGRLIGSATTDITSLCYSSDEAIPGSLFFCVPGFRSDGHDFAPQAVEKGAVALCTERRLDLPVAQVLVPSVRRAMGPMAAAFFEHPSERLMTAGVTGTNGKTTTAFLLAHLLDKAGARAGLMGTVERRVGGKRLPAGRTTPEALDIQRHLSEMVAAGDKAAVMEVLSHALDLGRTLGVRFDALAFTNLTQDHLDYHKTIEQYFEAKSLLFLEESYQAGAPLAVMNVDDQYGLKLAVQLPRERVMGFSTSSVPGAWGPPELEWSDYSVERKGVHGTLTVRGKALELAGGAAASSGRGEDDSAALRLAVSAPVLGEFNVANTLTALGLGLVLGLDLTRMLADLKDFSGVPGRMEAVEAGQDFVVLVDYAHTPDSIRNALETARGFTKGRLIAVVGCGGDRDKGKRPLMGREAEEASDLLFITSDNPRSEDPLAIIDDMLAGLVSPGEARVEPDRRRAIAQAVGEASGEDVVLILGKGHESGQETAGRITPFDDRQVAREALSALTGDKQ